MGIEDFQTVALMTQLTKLEFCGNTINLCCSTEDLNELSALSSLQYLNLFWHLVSLRLYKSWLVNGSICSTAVTCSTFRLSAGSVLLILTNQTLNSKLPCSGRRNTAALVHQAMTQMAMIVSLMTYSINHDQLHLKHAAGAESL